MFFSKRLNQTCYICSFDMSGVFITVKFHAVKIYELWWMYDVTRSWAVVPSTAVSASVAQVWILTNQRGEMGCPRVTSSLPGVPECQGHERSTIKNGEYLFNTITPNNTYDLKWTSNYVLTIHKFYNFTEAVALEIFDSKWGRVSYHVELCSCIFITCRSRTHGFWRQNAFSALISATISLGSVDQ